MNRLTVPPQFEDGFGRGPAAAAANDIERRFRVATRHSRLVRLLRIGIPIGVILLTLMLMALAWFNPLSMISNLPVEIGNVVISGTKITMESPRVSGFTKDNRAYALNARAASQDITRPDRLELKDMRGKIEMEDKSIVNLTAVNGVYDTKTEMLTLTDNILIKSSNGYEGRLSEAVIDIKAGHIISQKPVELKMLEGDLVANRFEVSKSGDVIVFEGGVTINMDMEKINKAREEKAKAAAAAASADGKTENKAGKTRNDSAKGATADCADRKQ
jgi:lipopolysaccharide export system protein LptC